MKAVYLLIGGLIGLIILIGGVSLFIRPQMPKTPLPTATPSAALAPNVNKSPSLFTFPTPMSTNSQTAPQQPVIINNTVAQPTSAPQPTPQPTLQPTPTPNRTIIDTVKSLL